MLTYRFLSAADTCFLLAVWSLVLAEITFMLAQSFDLSLHQAAEFPTLSMTQRSSSFVTPNACAHDLAFRALPRSILDRSCCSGLVRLMDRLASAGVSLMQTFE